MAKEAMHNSARPMATLLTARTLTSRRSWRSAGTSRLKCSSSGAPWISGFLSAMIQSPLQIGFAQRHQRPLLQLPEKVCQPDADQSGRSGHVHPAKVEPLAVEVGRDLPVDVHHANEQDEHRYFAKQLGIALEIARQQQRKRQRKMEEHQRQPDVSPPA